MIKETSYNYKNAWFYNFTVDDILNRIRYMNPNLKVKTIKTLIFEDDLSEYQMKQYIFTGFKPFLINNKIDKNIDLILIPIIYLDHFTVIILDFKLNIMSFYDSAGYNSNNILKNSDITYIFLNSDMSYSKYQYPNYDKLEAESVRYFYVNVFINVVK